MLDLRTFVAVLIFMFLGGCYKAVPPDANELRMDQAQKYYQKKETSYTDFASWFYFPQKEEYAFNKSYKSYKDRRFLLIDENTKSKVVIRFSAKGAYCAILPLDKNGSSKAVLDGFFSHKCPPFESLEYRNELYERDSYVLKSAVSLPPKMYLFLVQKMKLPKTSISCYKTDDKGISAACVVKRKSFTGRSFSYYNGVCHQADTYGNYFKDNNHRYDKEYLKFLPEITALITRNGDGAVIHNGPRLGHDPTYTPLDGDYKYMLDKVSKYDRTEYFSYLSRNKCLNLIQCSDKPYEYGSVISPGAKTFVCKYSYVTDK